MSSKEEEYKEIFHAETLENFEEINLILTQLEKQPDDNSLIDALFRLTHTIKGNAAGMGFNEIAKLAHGMEDLFGAIKDKKLRLNKEIFTAMYKANDILGALTQALKTGEKVAYRGIATKLKVLVEKAETETPVEKDLKKTKTSRKQAVSRKPAAKKRSKAVQEDELPPTEEIMEALQEEVKSQQPETGKSVSMVSDLVQVPVRKLDSLLDLVGELIIERDRIIASHSPDGRNNEFSRLKRISSDLQYSVMDVRLVQVGFLFNKFHRVVRDAAEVEHKNVKLELAGTDTEIDRNILQIISDSLIHLIRNSISHGLESAEERKKANKPEEGVVTLSAENDSDGVLIKISDDGKGIDLDKVREKAVSNGLIKPEMARMMNEEELLMLIFEPGFSTRNEVSSLSGRGVGMDVVKKATDSIGGNIKVETFSGKGTTISLKLPSSMAVKGTLLFMLDTQTYAIPLSYTEAVVSLYKKDLHKVGNGLVSTFSGKTISIVFLNDLFDWCTEGSGAMHRLYQTNIDQLHPEEQLNVVIVSYNGRTIGLVVDKLLQQKEIVEKPLCKPLDKVKILSGMTILGDGNVCPVLNVAVISNMVFNASLTNHKSF